MEYFHRQYNRPGSAPGMVEAGDEAPPTEGWRIRLVCYDAARFEDRDGIDLDAALAPAPGLKLWLDVAGKPDPALLRRLGERFGLHTLALEDVMHAGQRPKVEAFGDQVFVVLNMPLWRERWLAIQQVSLFLGADFVISFHSGSADIFEPVRRRMESSPGGRLRGNRADYLLYALTDLVVDQNFPILEGYGEELQEIESILVGKLTANLQERIHETRRELVFLKRALWSQRDATHSLLHKDIEQIAAETRLYLRDCHDHASHVLELVENYLDMAAALLEMQLANINQRTNESMRVLTVIATIFIPLSFLVGLYGMNFDTSSPWNMPELGWRYGYLFVWVLIVAVAGGMLAYFKRRGWW